MNSQSTQRQTWLKAAVIGSLWASLEIVIGSFLHNIHAPFAGTTLGFLSLSLLIAFHQKWQDKGLILRAAIIAALMRSLSPSAIIIGPMVGIFLEGILLETSIRFFGKNKLGYFLGAFATLSSNLLQKVVSLLIFYGFDIVVVVKNMYFYVLKQLNIPSLQLSTLILILLAFYAVFAVMATFLGYIAGKRALKQEAKSLSVQFSDEKKLFVNNPNQKQYTALLFVHLLIIIMGLFILSYAHYLLSLTSVILYVLIVNWKYPNSFRRLARPKFWVQLLILILFTTLFFNGFSSKNLFDIDGLLAGLTMSFRAILLITAFTAISYELRNPVVKAVLYKKGYSQLYVSLGLAFGALPSLLEQLLTARNILKSPSKQIAQLINYADDLLQSFQKKANKEQKIIIISGLQRQGKTTFLEEILSLLKEEKIVVDGIVAKGIDRNNKREGFILSHIKSGKTFELATTKQTKGFIKYGRFYFDESIFKEVNTLLVKSSSDYVVIDEVGPLELQEKGWATAIDTLLDIDAPMIWVVRKSILEQVIKHYHVSHAQVFDIGKYSPSKVVGAMLKQLND